MALKSSFLVCCAQIYNHLNAFSFLLLFFNMKKYWGCLFIYLNIFLIFFFFGASIHCRVNFKVQYVECVDDVNIPYLFSLSFYFLYHAVYVYTPLNISSPEYLRMYGTYFHNKQNEYQERNRNANLNWKLIRMRLIIYRDEYTCVVLYFFVIFILYY